MSSDNKMSINMQRIGADQSPAALAEGEAHLFPVHHGMAQRWLDLTLHLADLKSVLVWVELLVHQHTQPTPETHALWTSSLVTFFKFLKRSASRVELDASVVLANEPEEGRAQFLILQSLRDKAVVHDENTCAQGAVLVPIANPDVQWHEEGRRL